MKFTFRFSVTCALANVARVGLPSALQACEDARIQQISDTIGRLTRIRDMKWNVLSSDRIYALSNILASQEPKLESSWMITLQCITARDVDVAEIFLLVSRACEEMGVGDWGLNETTLEDVFVKVVMSS